MIQFLLEYWGWIVGVLIVVVGLLTIGRDDISRFSISRAWAISGVCFDESIRKKVLWITPLAIVGVIVVSQLQRALDEQDAIRQTIKFCIFASALVVVLSSLILACTNLPKEIESRVIYTIVTKPTTRLELIVGKVIGFARVSAAILVIMGVFTLGYLLIRERGQLRQIAIRLQNGNVSDTEKTRLHHYSETGLLSARHLWAADKLEIFGAKPDANSDKRILQGDGDEDVLVGFPVTREMFPDGAASGIGDVGLVIRMNVDWKRTGPIADSPDPDQLKAAPVQLGPAFATTQPETPAARPPGVTIDLADSNFNTIVGDSAIVGGTNRNTFAEHIASWVGDKEHKAPAWSAQKIRLHPEGGQGYAYAWLTPDDARARLFGRSVFYVRMMGANQNVSYEIGKNPIQIFVPQALNGKLMLDLPPAIEIGRVKEKSGSPEPMTFLGRLGIHGELQLVGGTTAPMPAAVFAFRGAPSANLVNGQIPFEITNLQIQRSNESDNDESREDPTNLAVTVHDNRSGRDTPVNVQVETRQTTFFTVPAGAIAGPDYDVIIQCSNAGHTVGFYAESLQLVMSRQPFFWNLFLSLSIVWMMSILVIILSILCSTFVNWPIAIVLTVILLLGHWGMDQLSDVNRPGLGRQMENQWKIGDKDAPVAKAFTTTVDALSGFSNAIGKLLPETEQFDSISDIEQGMSVSWTTLGESLKVLFGFGIPAVVLAYILLKYKEVAP